MRRGHRPRRMCYTYTMEYSSEQNPNTHFEREADRLYNGLTTVEYLAFSYTPRELDAIMLLHDQKYTIE